MLLFALVFKHYTRLRPQILFLLTCFLPQGHFCGPALTASREGASTPKHCPAASACDWWGKLIKNHSLHWAASGCAPAYLPPERTAVPAGQTSCLAQSTVDRSLASPALWELPESRRVKFPLAGAKHSPLECGLCSPGGTARLQLLPQQQEEEFADLFLEHCLWRPEIRYFSSPQMQTILFLLLLFHHQKKKGRRGRGDISFVWDHTACSFRHFWKFWPLTHKSILLLASMCSWGLCISTHPSPG